jgi:hypothetical protein
MTQEEATKVASILLTADGGCSHCANNLFKNIAEIFPEFDWEALKKTKSYFDILDEKDAR